MKDRIQLLGAVILTAAILLFAYQNLDPTPIKFLIWEFASSVSLVTLSAFLGGLLTGAAGVALRKRKKHKELKGEAKSEERAKEKVLAPAKPAAQIDLKKQQDAGGLSDADRRLLMEAGLGDKDEE